MRHESGHRTSPRRKLFWAFVCLAVLLAVAVGGLIQLGSGFELDLYGSAAGDTGLSWAPDGKRLVVARDSTGDGDLDLYELDADGTNAHRLTRHTGADAPAVSRDGSRIAFVAYRANNSNNLFVARADGSGATALARTTLDEEDPAWSPDGRWLAFSRMEGQADDPWPAWLVVARADGGGRPRRLVQTDASIAQQHPSWSPDGRFIVYAGSNGIYVIPSAGGKPRWVADGILADWAPHSDRLVVARDFETIEILRLRGGRRPVVTRTFRISGGSSCACGFEDLDWAPRERRIGYSDGTSVFVLDLESSVVSRVSFCKQRCRTRARPVAVAPTVTTRPSGYRAPRGARGLVLVQQDPRTTDGDVYLVDVATGRARLLVRAADAISSVPQWSPDGRRPRLADARRP